MEKRICLCKALEVIPSIFSRHGTQFLSSSSLSSPVIEAPPPARETFFNPGDSDGTLRRLLRERRFIETLDLLCQQKRLKEAVQLLDDVDQPSAYLYSNLIELCLQRRALQEGKRIHAHINRFGFVPRVFIWNRLLDFYAKCGSLEDAQNVFDQMPYKDLCSWNTMISGYSKAGRIDDARKLFNEMSERDSFSWTAMISGYVGHQMSKEALELYRLMHNQGSLNCSNRFNMSSAITAAAAISSLRTGKEIHGRMLRIGLDSDNVVWSALSDMYAKCGSIKEARHIFDRTLDRDIVSWTTMIVRYFEDRKRNEGFTLFTEMLNSGIRPNDFTFAAILKACAEQAAENLGKEVHGHMVKVEFDPHSFAGSALVHLYAKCGNMRNARKVFKGMLKPDIVSWTSLISGYAQHGQPKEALDLFEGLLQSGVCPDHVSFVGVLSACTHAGLVDKGIEYFESIKNKHGLTPTVEHYACLVDLLSRSGRFKEAEEYINSMPMKPDKFLWASFLGGCRIHKNVELAERAASELFLIEPENAATYTTLANIYASAGRWDEVASVRKLMDDRKVVKKPGLSWIEHKRRAHIFLVGDKSHPNYKEIDEFLRMMWMKMKEEGYVPETDFVLHDIEEEQKEESLSYHSEKLAVAFGIISTPPGTPIKVYKNLRTCVDCHNAIKFISRIAERRIIVRDSNRFHCFENGNCSCQDFW